MGHSGCRASDHVKVARREFLRAGGLTLFGLGLTDLLRLESHSWPSQSLVKKPARSVVFIFQSGGPSQHETFDPKPEAPEGIRGEYGVTATAIPGVRFCEHLPRLAARADRFTVVRTMHHPAERQFRNEHSSSTYLLHTGSTQMPPGDTNASIALPRPGRFEWPSIGSLVAYAAPPAADAGLPAMVEIPRKNHTNYPGRGSGMLGPRYDRWTVDLAPPCRAPDPAGSCPNCFSHDDPNDPARAPGKGRKAWWDNSSCRDPSFHLPEGVADGVSLPSIGGRIDLLGRLEALRREVDTAYKAGRLDNWDEHRHQALRLLLSSRPGRENPFDLSREPERVRDLYGREEWGQGLLAARRLVEAGVRMVQVNLRGWDTHQNAFRDLKRKLLPSIDRALSGFLDDLAARGLLDETLVVMCGEMGRTPRISPISPNGKNASGEPFAPGRHHWGDVFPCFFAGGGVRGGQVIGRTDRQGGSPVTEAFTPSDLAATIFQALGVDPRAEFQDTAGRPYRVYLGAPIPGLLG